MADNRATELLRKLLDERGVKWRESVNVANCVFTIYESPIFGEIAAMDNGDYLYFHELNGISVTPEQAIAATLWSERELIDLAHNAWSMALCAMNGMPIPADWGDAVERGLREHGIDVDGELAGFEVSDDER